MGLGDFLGGTQAKVKSAWQNTPQQVKDLVTTEAGGLTDISKDALKQYQLAGKAGYQQYGGQRVAGFDPTEQAGLDVLTAMPGQQAGIEGQINELGGLDTTLAGNTEMIQALYNPYQQDVINATMSDLDRQHQMDQLRRNAAAGAAGSFGGSRAGVMDALAAGETSRADAATLAGLRQTGWNTAAGLASQDLTRQAGYDQNYLNALNQLYGTKGAQSLQLSQGLEGIGKTQRDINQAGLDVAYGDFQERQNFPWMNMQRAQGIISKYDPAAQAAGAASTTTPGSPGLINTVAGAAAAGAGAFMACDARLKSNVSEVARLPSGAGLFSFRYVWETPDAPLHVGPIAQDLVRYVPEAVLVDELGTLWVDLGQVR